MCLSPPVHTCHDPATPGALPPPLLELASPGAHPASPADPQTALWLAKPS